MKKILVAGCLLCITVWCKAQSYHFSQFFSTPLLTNPAHTGFTNGPFRMSSNIRSQGIPGNTFFTGYVSADVSALRNKLPEGHKAGLGVYAMNDHSLSSAIQTNSAGLSAAYNVGLDIYGERSFGLGIQATYNQRRIDYSKLTFENQYGPGGYDGTLPAGEPLDFNSKSFFDVNVGAMYNAFLSDKAFFVGVSGYNLLQHKESVFEEDFKMPMRITLQGAAQFQISPVEKVYGSLTSMYQAKANEIIVGAAYGIQLTEASTKNELTGGLWYRFQDAVIPYVGYQYNNWQVGLSYDYTLSSAKAGQIKNAYELTLQFRAPDIRELKTTISWF